MAVIYDLIPAEARAKYPIETLTPKWQRRLSERLPDGVDMRRAAGLGAAIATRLPRATAVHAAAARVRREQNPNLVTVAEGPWPGARTTRVVAPDVAEAERRGLDLTDANRRGDETATQRAYKGLPRAGKIGARVAARMVGAASGRGLPLVGDRFPRTDNLVPEADGWDERAADVVGGLAGFTAIAAPATAAAATAGVPAAAAGALGMGAAAMAPEGSVPQRIVRGVTTAALSRAGSAVGNRVGGAVAGAASRIRLPNAIARALAQSAIARFVPYGTAERLIAGATEKQALA